MVYSSKYKFVLTTASEAEYEVSAFNILFLTFFHVYMTEGKDEENEHNREKVFGVVSSGI